MANVAKAFNLAKRTAGLEARGNIASHSMDELDNASLKSYRKHMRKASEAESARLQNNPVSEVEHGRLSQGEKNSIAAAFGGERNAVTKSLERHQRNLPKASHRESRELRNNPQSEPMQDVFTREKARADAQVAFGSTAMPASSVANSPAANTKLEGFGGGTGTAAQGPVQKIMLDAQKAAREGKQVGETPAAPKSGEPVSQSAGFGGGAGATKGPMDDFFEAKLNAKELSNADRHKLERVRDSYQNYMAEIKEANGNQEEIAKVRDKYGIKGQSGPVDHFTAKANEDATTMDWMMGNHVPQYGAGSLMLGGAVAACFSNKGQMSNSELYGQNF